MPGTTLNSLCESKTELQPDCRSRGQKMLAASLERTRGDKMVNDMEHVNAWLDNNEVVASSVYEDSVVFPDIAKHAEIKSKKTLMKNPFTFEPSDYQSNSSILSDLRPAVPSYKRQTNSKRNYDKRQACFFCKKLVSKSKRHLESVHPNEMDLVSLARKSKKQQDIEYERIRVLGNFNHNVVVLREKVGQLIVVRRSVGIKTCSDYLPCIFCYGFFEQEQLWRHVRACIHRPSVQDDEGESALTISSIKSQSRMLLEGAGLHMNQVTSKNDYSELNETVIEKMRNDDVTSVVANDEIILSFGNGLLEKKGTEKRHEIGQRMRQVARLLMEVRRIEKKKVDLSTCLSGIWFDKVVFATRQLCVVQKETTIGGVKMLEKPSLGVHLGHSLLKCCAVKRGRSLKNNSVVEHEESTAFAELMGIEWNNKVSSGALQTLKERRFDKVEVLPLTSDLLILRNFVSKELVCAKQNLAENFNDANWKRLSNLVFVAVTCFNKRRGGEVAKMTLKAFINRPAWRDIHNDEFKKSLTILELKLLERYNIICSNYDSSSSA